MKKIKKRKKRIQKKAIAYMTSEEKNKVNDYRKNWYRLLDEEKINKFGEYARNRYYAVSVC